MPRSAIEAVIADVVAPVEDLPAKLRAILKFIPVVNKDAEIDTKNKSSLGKIIFLLREQSGNDYAVSYFRRPY